MSAGAFPSWRRLAAGAALGGVLASAALATSVAVAPADGPHRRLLPAASAMESLGLRATDARDRWATVQLAAWSALGSAPAARELAWARLHGGDVERGRAALLRAATLGDGEAAWQLAAAHRLGRWGLAEDLQAATQWYRRATDAGHADAPLWLARMARNGLGRTADAGEAVRWLQLSAERGNAQAMFLLSNALAAGDGVPVSREAARTWLERSAERHHGPAMQAWALALEDGSLGVVDPDEARAVLKEAHDERRHRWNAR